MKNTTTKIEQMLQLQIKKTTPSQAALVAVGLMYNKV